MSATEHGGGVFGRLRAGLAKTRKAIGDRLAGVWGPGQPVDESLFEALEEALLAADVGLPTTEALVDTVRSRVREARGAADSEAVRQLLIEEIGAMLSHDGAALAEPVSDPVAYMMVGVNGSGKTTSAGKLACQQTACGKKVVLGAADTFRAAAIEQLGVWATRAGADLVAHQTGADPGAVAFDAAQAARARKADLLIVDTAGRLHTKSNLMDELAKVHRVAGKAWGSPFDEVLLVVDGTTGQNGLAQAKEFGRTVPLSGVILTKLDGSAKGGIVLAIAVELGLPIKRIGVGEASDDLHPFEPADFARALLDA